MIEKIERYRFDGKEFETLPDVSRYVGNEIGKVIDSTQQFRLPPKEALAVYEALIKHRKRLIVLLSAAYEIEDCEIQGERRSIFDL